LLVGQEIAQLAEVRERVSDPAKRSADLAQVLPQLLPEAVRGARQKSLRDALEPIFEKAFQSSVRKNPGELAGAIYPIMGPAIRNSIAAAIREFAESLNQIVEKSVSFRAIRWRIESLVTGKSFSEILLARSLLYSVEQVFLIHRPSGLLLIHVAAKQAVLKDADMISGMLTAIQDFLSDSFAESGQDLETIDAGRFKLWMQYGPNVVLAAAVAGTAPVELRSVFRTALDQIQQLTASELANFKQDVSAFEPARPILEKCLLGQAGDKRKSARLWPYAVVLALLLIALFIWRYREASRWDGYFAAVKQQPGIVLTSIEKHGRSYVVSGLRDPLAPDPAALLRARGLDASKVAWFWTPWLSLNTPFAAQRELQADTAQLGRQHVHFDVGSSRIPVTESDRLEQLAQTLIRLTEAQRGLRVQVIGRADDTGSVATNQKLSIDRASNVAAALQTLGVPESSLEPVGLGNTQPLRTGSSDWDRATNRSVAFRIVTAGRG
jgi:OOP family OmpA-OmpF porin